MTPRLHLLPYLFGFIALWAAEGDGAPLGGNPHHCEESLSAAALPSHYVGRSVRLTTVRGTMFWGTLLEPVLAGEAKLEWHLPLDEGGNIGIRRYPLSEVATVSYRDGDAEFVVTEVQNPNASFSSAEGEAENNKVLAANAAHVAFSVIPVVLTLPTDTALSMIYRHMLKGFRFLNFISPNAVDQEARNAMIRQRPLRHEMAFFAIYGEVVLAAPQHMESLYALFIEKLTALMFEARSYTVPGRTLEDRLLTVAVWAKEVFTSIQFLVDANTRDGRMVFLYALQRSCYLAGLDPEHCPRIDLRESRWSALTVEYTTIHGEQARYQPFGDSYKDYLATRFLNGIGEFSETMNAPYFVYVGTELPHSEQVTALFSRLRGHPESLTFQEFSSGLKVDSHIGEHASTAASVELPTRFQDRPEWQTVSDYFSSRIRAATLTDLLLDTSILAEASEITLELERH